MGRVTAEQTTQRPTPGARGYRVAIAAIGLTTAVASVTVLVHAFDPVYALPVGLVVAVVVAAVVSVVAAAAAVRAVRPDVAVLAALATFLLLFAAAGMLTIGIFVLPFAIVALVVTTRRASSAGKHGGRAAATGAVMAVGLAFAALVAIQEPLVRCGRDGSVSTSTPIWWTGSSSTASGSSSAPAADGTTEHRGQITVGDRTARYECRNGTVTRFEVD